MYKTVLCILSRRVNCLICYKGTELWSGHFIDINKSRIKFDQEFHFFLHTSARGLSLGFEFAAAELYGHLQYNNYIVENSDLQDRDIQRISLTELCLVQKVNCITVCWIWEVNTIATHQISHVPTRAMGNSQRNRRVSTMLCSNLAELSWQP